MNRLAADEPSDQVLLVENRGRARWLWLNRPTRRNALNEELVTALDSALTDAEDDPSTHVLVIAGKGKSFCAGADLRHLLGLSDNGVHPITFLEQVSALFTRIERSRLPVVALLHGHAIAGGIELALACDVVIAADDTLIGDGHVRNSLIPAGGGSVRLARRVGDAMARHLMLTGASLPAHVLKSCGWPFATVPHDELHAAGEREADLLAAHAGPAQARMKQLLAALDDVPTHAALSAELEAFRTHWDETRVADAVRTFVTGSERSNQAR
ncbi:enoyl-CoA hydratase/isomerase family protein [Nocardioides pocheonensis]|uniref:Enoyl-CoA hydratase/isomerase family protein n=1 Tax=Nocardioides pocheonensis TaxID=661485 RepID=A0A3N0GIU9_9ACTN|nr:enoyl-CoA hydratase/isomerase family protein [Nocardioides pocheonensis]RNM12038.1 enoyl-CoA hydratase/isomerase family protein [Nocardioides pocheonensis]